MSQNPDIQNKTGGQNPSNQKEHQKAGGLQVEPDPGAERDAKDRDGQDKLGGPHKPKASGYDEKQGNAQGTTVKPSGQQAP